MLLFYIIGNGRELNISIPDIIYLMDKHRFIKLAGSQSELAKLLGIKQPAISQWKAVPLARIWQLKLLKPEWFDK
jgi:predicted XRE-type DNA-binding protein